jgi:hypothetical protein
MTTFATTGLPRVGSLGFSDNYMCDALPPPAFNFDENNQTPAAFEGLSMKLFQSINPADVAARLTKTKHELEVPTEMAVKKKFWGAWGKKQKNPNVVQNEVPKRKRFAISFISISACKINKK